MDVEKQRGRWPWMRITVDLIGIRRIERLGERPRYHGEDTEENGLQYGYAMVNVDELKGVIAEVKVRFPTVCLFVIEAFRRYSPTNQCLAQATSASSPQRTSLPTTNGLLHLEH